ncbi:cytochrome P450 [Serendipita vermifera]|nr:cytochrome P450 [Serendipita vermifera]
MDQSALLFAASGITSGALLWSYISSQNQKKYHPGPSRLPVIGNLLQIPKETPWTTYREWSKVYGPCVHLEIVGCHILILNDPKDADELLSKRGTTNSERPHLIMAGDLVGFGRGLALLPYDQDARETRKLIHLTVGQKSIPGHTALLESETKRFLRGLRDTPENFVGHLTYTAGAIILRIAYGYDVEPEKDPLVTLANEALDKFSKTTLLGEFPVDIFPILRHLPAWTPGVQFKKLAEEWRPLGRDLFDKPFDYVKDQMRQGTAQPSFSSKHLENTPVWDDHIIGSRAEVIKSTATSLYAGASDTTVSSLRSFFLAMTIYPEMQKRAQEEIENVIGFDRLPTLDDRNDLPFCNRLMKEVLRWGVVGPLGIPHVSKADDEYQGCFIPKGTLIVANIWGILHDEVRYPDPDTFNPDRFLDEEQPDPTKYVFGFGRRVCPGSHLAIASMFLSITQTLALFDIRRMRNENGEEVVPPAEFVTGMISHPKEFKCDIVPREGARLDLIEEASQETAPKHRKD